MYIWTSPVAFSMKCGIYSFIFWVDGIFSIYCSVEYNMESNNVLLFPLTLYNALQFAVHNLICSVYISEMINIVYTHTCM